jgi:hypothetical protein
MSSIEQDSKEHKITLPWANKFRRLVKENFSYQNVVEKFLIYCDEEELDITKRWHNQQLKEINNKWKELKK